MRELGRWDGVPRTRAAALAKARDTGRSKLLLLYTWGLWDVMDVFRTQVRCVGGMLRAGVVGASCGAIECYPTRPWLHTLTYVYLPPPPSPFPRPAC